LYLGTFVPTTFFLEGNLRYWCFFLEAEGPDYFTT
jgi:hypothetical protein